MRFVLCFLLYLLSSLPLHAETFTRITMDGVEKVGLTKKDKYFVSQNCLSNKCQALNSQVVNSNIIESVRGYYVPEHAQACRQRKSAIVVLSDENGNAYEFCEFQDKSLIQVGAFNEE